MPRPAAEKRGGCDTPVAAHRRRPVCGNHTAPPFLCRRRRSEWSVEAAPSPQRLHHSFREHRRWHAAAGEDEVMIQWRLVGRIDAGEVADLARPRTTIESLRIAGLAGRQRRVDIDLDELAGLDNGPRQLTLRAE